MDTDDEKQQPKLEQSVETASVPEPEVASPGDEATERPETDDAADVAVAQTNAGWPLSQPAVAGSDTIRVDEADIKQQEIEAKEEAKEVEPAPAAVNEPVVSSDELTTLTHTIARKWRDIGKDTIADTIERILSDDPSVAEDAEASDQTAGGDSAVTADVSTDTVE
jgi:hypothetical protein